MGTRPHITGREHIPKSGAVLLVSNHLSLADPVVLMRASPRPLVFMAKEELWRSPPARAILRFWGGSFPVRRGQADIGAVRDALELLRAGYPLVLFPEGTRHPEGLGPAHPGVGYIASRAHCPILPVAITGTDSIRGFSSLLRRPRYAVQFGAPLAFSPEGMAGAEVVEHVMRGVAALLPPDRRGIYADARGAADVG